MNDGKMLKTAGLWFVILPPLYILIFTMMSLYFDYPAILREPAGHILRLYQEKGVLLKGYWYGLVVCSFLIIFLAIVTHNLLDTGKKSLSLQFATVSGIIAGLANALGFVRWMWLVPNLAGMYLDPHATEVTREAVKITFESFHLYAGFSIGEHFGMSLLGIWGVIISCKLLGTKLLNRWLAWIGIAVSAGVAFGALEGFGIEAAGLVVALCSNLWGIWMIAAGIIFIARSKKSFTGDYRKE
jgi:hypothetical protein